MGRVCSPVSPRGDILAEFQLTHLSLAAGELVSTHGLRQGVALRLQRSPNTCLPNPCQHQGGCQVMEDRPVCSCKPGFTGTFCQGRAGDVGESSSLCPRAPVGRVMGTVHWCCQFSSPQAPGARPSSWFGCIPPPPLCPDGTLVQRPATGHFLSLQKS